MNSKITKGEIIDFLNSFGLNGQESENFHRAYEDILLSSVPKESSYLYIASFLKCALIS